MPAFQQEKTINARLRSGPIDISASDWLMPNRTRVRGNTVCLYLSGGTFEELKTPVRETLRGRSKSPIL